MPDPGALITGRPSTLRSPVLDSGPFTGGRHSAATAEPVARQTRRRSRASARSATWSLWFRSPTRSGTPPAYAPATCPSGPFACCLQRHQVLAVAQELSKWLKEGREFAVATVVGVRGSAPRGLGAALAVDRDGTVVGSVAGDCVEGVVYDLCTQALDDGGSVVERFGYSDEDAFAVGLACGGIIDILVTPVTAGTPARAVLRSALAGAAPDEPAALTLVIRRPAEAGRHRRQQPPGGGDRSPAPWQPQRLDGVHRVRRRPGLPRRTDHRRRRPQRHRPAHPTPQTTGQTHLSPQQEAENAVHRRVRARVEHAPLQPGQSTMPSHGHFRVRSCETASSKVTAFTKQCSASPGGPGGTLPIANASGDGLVGSGT